MLFRVSCSSYPLGGGIALLSGRTVLISCMGRPPFIIVIVLYNVATRQGDDPRMRQRGSYYTTKRRETRQDLEIFRGCLIVFNNSSCCLPESRMSLAGAFFYRVLPPCTRPRNHGPFVAARGVKLLCLTKKDRFVRIVL